MGNIVNSIFENPNFFRGPQFLAATMISLCRPASIYPSLNKTTLVHSYPRSSVKFTDLPLHCAKLVSSLSSMEAPPSEYRKNVGICLINPSNNKVFSASRLDIPGAWQMPQGGVDEGEDPRNAAIRELREETGVKSAEILAEAPYWLTYDFPPEVRVKLNKRWGTSWKGQAQKCDIPIVMSCFLKVDNQGNTACEHANYARFLCRFLLRFTGKDEEINLLGDGSEKPEFAEWSWMTPQQVIDHAADFKKPVYEEVLKVFAPHLQSDSCVQV